MIFDELSIAFFRFFLRCLGAELVGGGGGVQTPPPPHTRSWKIQTDTGARDKTIPTGIGLNLYTFGVFLAPSPIISNFNIKSMALAW